MVLSLQWGRQKVADTMGLFAVSVGPLRSRARSVRTWSRNVSAISASSVNSSALRWVRWIYTYLFLLSKATNVIWQQKGLCNSDLHSFFSRVAVFEMCRGKGHNVPLCTQQTPPSPTKESLNKQSAAAFIYCLHVAFGPYPKMSVHSLQVSFIVFITEGACLRLWDVHYHWGVLKICYRCKVRNWNQAVWGEGTWN